MVSLVTGGNGFIGSNIVEVLLKKGKGVRVLAKPDSDLSVLKPILKDIEIVEKDIRDREGVIESMKGCSDVYHLAGKCLLWDKNPESYTDVNVNGTRNVVEGAIKNGLRRIVYTSTGDAMTFSNRSERKVFREEDFPNGNLGKVGPYGTSKLMAEDAIRTNSNGMDFVIVHPTCPIGKNDSMPTEPGKMIEEIIEKKLGGYINRVMNFVNVRDCAEGHVLAMESGVSGERYILGGENVNLGDFVRDVASIAGVKAPKISVPYCVALSFAHLSEKLSYFTGRTPRASVEGVKLVRGDFAFNSDKARREIGYEITPLEVAVGEAVDWHRGRISKS